MGEMLQKVRQRVMEHPLLRLPLLASRRSAGAELCNRWGKLRLCKDRWIINAVMTRRREVRCVGVVFLGATPRHGLHSTL